MQTITIGIQPLAELRAEMLAVARGERKADPDAPKVRFESLQALAKALQTDVATVKRVLLPAPSTADDLLDELQEVTGKGAGTRRVDD
jgi:predicted transcriptional regulator